MDKNFDRDDFLAKWVSDELSPEEKEAFKNSDDFPYFEAILKGTDLLEVPDYDNDALYKKLKNNISNKKKVVPLIPKWIYAAAASILLIIGYVTLFNTTKSYETNFGEQLVVLLPDNSEVILNAKSTLEYNKKEWKNNKRNVTLNGEAFFKVEKGGDFEVETANATIAVLGTQFTVTDNNTTFEVVCYEGKVKVDNDSLSEILTKGMGLRKVNNTYENVDVSDTIPAWINGESSFTNAPIHQVIEALENQYNISFISDKIDRNLRFTGSFTHTNIETALHSVFDSMEIKFTFINEITIDLVKE